MLIPTLNPVTTGRGDFIEFLDASQNAGFTAIEYPIVPFDQIAQERSVDAAKDLLDSRGLVLGSFGLPVNFREGEQQFQEDLRLLPRRASLARELGVTRCCTFLLPSTDEPVAELTCRFVRRLRGCAKVLDANGIRFGIEWVGPKTSRTKKYDFLHTMEGVLELIGAIGEPNVGLLFDSYHWFTTASTREDIEKLSAEQIVLVHINDAPNKPIDEQIDMQRLLPGEGIIDLRGMLASLVKIGYDGFVSIETFSDDLPKLGQKEAARRAKEAIDKVL